jgi:hypothetical protein
MDQRPPGDSTAGHPGSDLHRSSDPAEEDVAGSAGIPDPAVSPTTVEDGVDPRSPEVVEHFADQVAVLARLIGSIPPADGDAVTSAAAAWR